MHELKRIPASVELSARTKCMWATIRAGESSPRGRFWRARRGKTPWQHSTNMQRVASPAPSGKNAVPTRRVRTLNAPLRPPSEDMETRREAKTVTPTPLHDDRHPLQLLGPLHTKRH